MRKISIIIVSWNATEYLRNCLNSIRRTTQRLDVEVLVVDNASSDGSADMVAASFPEVKLICTKENLGFARANNLGMKHANGHYYALVNSDVIVHDECLQTLVDFLEQHPKVGLIGPWITGGNGELQRTCRRFPTVWNTMCRTLALDVILGRWSLFSGREMRHWNHDELAEVEVLSGCFWLARREAAAEVGGLDERFFFYAEDVDWCKRFRDSGWKVMFVPFASATHFGGASSGNAPLRYSIELLRANVTYWQKHYPLIGRVSFRLLLLVHHAVRLAAYALRSLVSHSSARVETLYKCRRSWVCLRWLITGQGA